MATHINHTNITAGSGQNTHVDHIGSDDATWILTSAFIIFTMQSGFGLLESGMVSSKNEANIMVKNAVDVIYGGLSYWLFGFALSFGKSDRNNPFCGLGHFLTDVEEHEMGGVYARYFFQLSFSTTSTTIVSGAMAERVNLKAYTLFSFINTVTYCFPAHWMWDDYGWLRQLGAVDIAGCAAVHLVGGISGLVATIYLKPRTGVFDSKAPPAQMASPTNVLLGTFMLWWGWLGFNCGSTFGISGTKWKLASRSAVVTINGSIGGGIMGMFYSDLQISWGKHWVVVSSMYFGWSYTFYKGKLSIPVFVTGILGGLVSITAVCSIARPWEAIVISLIGGLIACSGCQMLHKLKIDDPVGCVPVHAFSGIWGLTAVGLFAEKDKLENTFSWSAGIFKGGPWRFLGVQLLTIVSIIAWTVVITYIELVIVDKLIPIRVSLNDELIGADRSEHGISQGGSDNGEHEEEGNRYRNNIEQNREHDSGTHASGSIEAASTESESRSLGTYMRRLKVQFHYIERKSMVVDGEELPQQQSDGAVHFEDNPAFEKDPDQVP